MIVIIDYNMGNTGSVQNAVSSLGYDVIISSKKEYIESSSHLILPGVGTFYNGMKNLNKFGLTEILRREVLKKNKPLLGICLGMQIMAEEGEEGGLCQGLGLIKGRVRKLLINESRLKLPHIGWNNVELREKTRLFHGIKQPIFYFVHSFCLVPEDDSLISARAEYGELFAVAIEKNNIFGCQFHPEKSQREGLKVLENFLTS